MSSTTGSCKINIGTKSSCVSSCVSHLKPVLRNAFLGVASLAAVTRFTNSSYCPDPSWLSKANSLASQYDVCTNAVWASAAALTGLAAVTAYDYFCREDVKSAVRHLGQKVVESTVDEVASSIEEQETEKPVERTRRGAIVLGMK